ncbi:hypothetical protein SASPL_157813 [Salvia splendens]|uniref:Uncharacterized protein n=1 Tax=Salvia splendens TaxID=180675 RepID=A0A8X8VUB0_SALSN|nr:hypothetical protein SASPL_157813 [Salvia splendens]
MAVFLSNDDSNPSELSLSALASDPPSELNVLGHNGHPLSMNGTEVGVLEQPNQVGLRRLLQRRHGGALEPEIRLEVLCDLTNQALERQLADEELSGLLVLPDLTKRDGSGAEAVGLLDAAGGGSGLPGCLGGELLPRRLAAGGLASGLLGMCEFGRSNSTISDRSRRVWTDKEATLIMAMKDLVATGWKSDNGFRAGYLTRIENIKRQHLPNTDLRVQP